MPGNRKITKKTIKGRENVHPGSRKANQLNRVQLRTTKLQHQAKTRKDLVSAKLHRPVFFLHSLPSPHALSLPSLRALVSSVYLARHDARMAELEGDRRPGRPKAKELLELEEVKKREQSEWETGIEVPDLTHAPTVKFLYSLVETNAPLRVSHLDILRQVRLFKDDPELVLVTREGNASRMGLIGENDVVEEGPDWTDGVVEEIPMEVEK